MKLGDFGLAKDNIWDPVSGARSICGTPEYMAPEVLNKVGHGSAVDWWGLGMLLYEMLTGLPPWYTKDRQKLFQRLRYAPLRIPPTMSLECASLVSSLLCRDAAERLGSQGVTEVRSHAFFAADPPMGFDWSLLEHRRMQPPINPMEGIRPPTDGTPEQHQTANFDPQFTRLAIETDSDAEQAENVDYVHFDGFTFAGSGSLELGSGDDMRVSTLESAAPDLTGLTLDLPDHMNIGAEGLGPDGVKMVYCPSAGELAEGEVNVEPRPLTVSTVAVLREGAGAADTTSENTCSTNPMHCQDVLARTHTLATPTVTTTAHKDWRASTSSTSTSALPPSLVLDTETTETVYDERGSKSTSLPVLGPSDASANSAEPPFDMAMLAAALPDQSTTLPRHLSDPTPTKAQLEMLKIVVPPAPAALSSLSPQSSDDLPPPPPPPDSPPLSR